MTRRVKDLQQTHYRNLAIQRNRPDSLNEAHARLCVNGSCKHCRGCALLPLTSAGDDCPYYSKAT